MKVFFTASYYGKRTYQKSYDMVRYALEKTGVEVISPEKGNYRQVLETKKLHQLPDAKSIHYEAIKKGILIADAVIIEVSQEDFQLGHEATLAIQAKKHVLCLSLHENFAEKIHHRYFHGAVYSEYTIDEIIEAFIEKTKRELFQERFNCFLSESQMHYIAEAAKEHEMNKSEYIRMLIDRDRAKQQ